jgi:hypothetical protein
MHKDLHGGNILMKKVENEFNNYIIDDKEYKIKSHGYIPVFIDFGYSTIFNIYTNKFEIYNTHNTRFKCITKYDNIMDSNTFINNDTSSADLSNYCYSSYLLIFFRATSLTNTKPLYLNSATTLRRTIRLSSFIGILRMGYRLLPYCDEPYCDAKLYYSFKFAYELVRLRYFHVNDSKTS